jgi:hypothetical protein
VKPSWREYKSERIGIDFGKRALECTVESENHKYYSTINSATLFLVTSNLFFESRTMSARQLLPLLWHGVEHRGRPLSKECAVLCDHCRMRDNAPRPGIDIKAHPRTCLLQLQIYAQSLSIAITLADILTLTFVTIHIKLHHSQTTINNKQQVEAL